ncbi:MAG: prepilin-type N-terminal cleavage/methylation domain-containing protein [Candidatus Omnitrophota bacterium]
MPARRVKNNRGFTLAELLIAASIIGMIGMIILATFAGGLRVYNRLRAYSVKEYDILISLEKIERDMRNSLGFSGVDFRGDAKKISFAAIVESAGPGGEKAMTLGRISYYADGLEGVLLKEEADYPRAVSEINTGKHALKELAAADDIKFSYFCFNSQDNRCEWKDSWNTEEKSDEEKSDDEESPGKKFPLAVNVEVTLKDGKNDIKLARTVFMPLAER